MGEASMRRPQSPADTPPAGQRPSKSTNPGKGKGTGTSQTLTLTALYNGLEAQREGRDLTAKEKAINDQGLVSVLKVLHDGLDAACPAFLKPWRHWAGRGGRGMVGGGNWVRVEVDAKVRLQQWNFMPALPGRPKRSAPTSRRQMGTKQSKLCPE